MADRYLRFTGTAPGRFLTRRLGLPQPAALVRWSPERPCLDGDLLHLTAGKSDLDLAGTGLSLTASSQRPAAVLLDATGVRDVEGLDEVHAALHPVVRSVAASGRVVVLGAPLDPDDHHQAAVQQALEGFTRSLGKEIGRGRTVNLVRLTDALAAESTLRFLLSPKSAYVSGQVVEVGDGRGAETGDGRIAAPEDRDRPLAGRTALVTGGARGIGEAVAETLARDGARVVVLDVPAALADAERVAARLGGTALALDITADDAGERIARALPDGLDVLVHNAGITRDRRLVNMPAERWSSVLQVNLASVLRTTDALLASGTLRSGGRVVATASIAGLAGNAGQTNYGASKAGVVGLVRSLAPRALAEHGVTVNAVAPGFIETRMTASIPLFIREAGRRMNSLAQGGLPADVAETTAWLAHPASGAVNGQVVRVCGQSLLGA
ncbi:3-ketoacyl-(acyl-carrier-protein) reductase [Streptomyces lincolnensis]|uniref:3-ketoacyl-(Acyl-carrier-protein) reductase n=1 Tax=Streptomyces lincolnensis TaxID=1915 RepID=A0A1B1MEU3_STRLN|nr:3-oxoacyl-ACP reductase [Streptomyces lincolnensis]ANS67139.1 3-ketoacyl-(acyl-carrier-protein) reductase [Streptomyces lincolnensis]AXG56010.1 3-ketoacyl-(acyl-carrier-protein) reductase [Streptomyces lincolnensis]QMV07515.1 3-oxoacyl-ACP reductase [Streptomyces lincolnensis]